MMEISMVRFIIGFLFIILGLIFFMIQLFGVFKFKYVLNRMHAAAMGDTQGISLVLIGLMIMFGFSFTTLKLILIVVFLWCSSPVASHLVSALQVETDEELEKHLTEDTLSNIEQMLEKKRENKCKEDV